MPHQLHSYAIFCDDVRQEANGKNLFIGAYRDIMVFNGPSPWLLPNFHVHVVYRDEEAGYLPPISFEVRLQTREGARALWRVDNPLFDAPYYAGHGWDSDIVPHRQIRFTVTLSQLSIPSDGRLLVVAVKNGIDHLIDRLRIVQNLPSPPPPPLPSSALASLFVPKLGS